jgi:transcriptional regulator with XRE-family HTH domain
MEMRPDDITTKLGSRIVKIRNEKGIRQVDLATFVNIDDSSLRKIESGRTNPTTRTLEKIANGLGVSIKDLFDFEQ